MGNILCKKLTIMDRKFDEKKTVKVSGISQLLRDQFTREFQTNKNSTGYNDDVNKLYICPNGEDCVLVEFAKDIPQDARVIGSTLKIGGTDLNVERWTSQASTEGPGSRLVSAIWPTDGPPLPENSDEQVLPQNETRPNGTDGKDRGNGKKLFGKDARHNEIANRRGLNSSPETTRGTPFNETTVKLDDDLVEKIQKEAKYKKILKEGEVNLDKKGYLTGTWNAIYGAGQKIISIISGSDQPGNSYDPANNFFFSSTNASNQSGDPTTATDQSPQSKDPDELFTVNPLFLRYIMAYHYEVFQKLQNVSKEISFENKSKTETDLKFFARKDVDKPTFSKTVDMFIDFVQARYPKMHEEVIPMLSKNKIDVLSEARMKYSVVMDSEQERDKITIYGEKENVEKAKKILNNKVGMSHPGSGSSKGATAEVGVIEKLSFELSKNLKLVVYQGDLTKENVDAIVNPANDRLQHHGGAALAIVKAGGRSIQDESEDIMRKRNYRPLRPSEVEVTGGGRLPCKFIVHAVGPIWDQHTPNTATALLYNAVLNSLSLACRNDATSISIPAISSGVYKVPVNVCAQVLFDAVVYFASKADKSIPLKEIRFVNIDNPTNRTFVQEMEKRFRGSIKREKFEAILSKYTKEQDGQTQTGQRQMAFTTTKSGTISDLDQTTSVTHKGSSHNPHSGDNKDTVLGGRPSDDKPLLLSYAGVTAGENPSTDNDPQPLKSKKTKDDECSICLSEFTKKKTLDKCGHSFCTKCIDKAFKIKKQCPICFMVYGPLKGNQPKGNMYDSYQSTYLPGYRSCGTIVISYRFLSGTQGPDHPNPGKPYMGTSRTAYLPDSQEGRKVLKLLKKAFEQKLTFTIGRSTTTGRDDCVTWNDIHHKTSTGGGPTHYGYPDPDYLKRVQDELAAKGITE